ncbi:threonine ammonia-lyase [Polymorphum gilvum]|uniref:Threonine dehydratase n=1 Tax=Polymorphum gilvum (strain LMG 25793 / CGMCC 1.9160 / SL003B-26A1) TaxID=991905 RepID=F2IWK8_POLGS|nr:threonine ammonia-lyase [Polymorphum gilvum]ADZ70334.1 Threonine dehydratase [Polymorphum gilvum SL003B-26A1]
MALSSLPPISLADIEDAARLIDGAVLRTPCLPAPKLSALTGADIVVKYENMQVTGAFKERGALVKLLSLSEAERRRGVIAMSAGNHAQAVACHAGRLGIPATIVMPEPTPFVKITATRDYGAEVVLAGDTLAEARARAQALADERGLAWVHPYDDLHVIRGQGTIALEMLAEAPDLDTLVVPIGGGGLISGIAVAAKALKPSLSVIGVEAKLYPSMWGAIHGKDVACGGPTIAEGIAVKDVGTLTRAVVERLVDDILLAEESAIERAINAYLTLQKTLAEGAGAAGLAALIGEPERFRGRRVGLVLCGGNIDPRLLSSIVIRELARDGRLVSVRIDTPDRPGVLGEITTLIGRMGGNVVDVSHHRLFLNVPAKGATLDVTFETFDAAHGRRIVAALEDKGYAVRLMDVAEAID